MKHIIFFVLILFPFTISAQQNIFFDSQLSYSWLYVGNAGFSEGPTSENCLVFSPLGQPFVAFRNYIDSNRVAVMKFDGSNWINVGESGFSVGMGEYLSLAFNPSDSLPYIAFQDKEDTLRATVRKFNGTNWVTVGDQGFSPSYAYNLSLAFNQSGQPYVAFIDWLYPYINKATVMKFDGTNWVYVGNQGFTAGHASFPSLAFNLNDEPYLAFLDWSMNAANAASVMRFNGTDWEYVGDAGFSPGVASETRLAFNSTNQPYIAFVDLENDVDRLSVMKFDGNSWIYEGTPNFSTRSVDFTNFAISPSDQPYVSYRDCENQAKASVMKFDGNNWENVGIPGFSVGNAACTSLAFDPIKGQAHIAYSDGGNFGKATVMKYDSVFTGIKSLLYSEYELYPNPVRTNLNITIKNANGISKILEIFDLKGNRIFESQSQANSFTINVENYPDGLYFFRIKTDYSILSGSFNKN